MTDQSFQSAHREFTPQAWAQAVTARIQHIVSDFARDLGVDAAQYEEFTAPLSFLFTGGKQLRAQLTRVGALCIQPQAFTAGSDCALVRATRDFGAAIELFQAAALAHDDIIDQAPTRRGQASAHTAYTGEHAAANYLLDGRHYGMAAAIVGGDWLLSLAFMAIGQCGEDATLRAECARAAQARFAAMCAQVAYGQYLDIRAEHLPWSHPQAKDREAAMEVILHKSATYSVTQPLLLGATLAGADAPTLALLAEALTPLGLAFQLRDDELGVFGDPEVTGKPAGGDLLEGKRTVLLALTFEKLAEGGAGEHADWLAHHLGQDLTAEEVERFRQIIRDSGAASAHEKLITDLAGQARERINTAPISEEGRAELLALAQRLTVREF